MAAAPTSYGYPNSAINAKDLPTWQQPLARFSVAGPNDWKVSTLGSLDRGIRVEAGTGSGDAVTDVFTEYETMSLPKPDIASRYYLIVRRRNWTAPGTTTLVAIPGSAARELPAVGLGANQRRNRPGDVSDHPIALVKVTQADTTIQEVVDLRVWAHNGGVEIADKLALNFLAEPGAAVKLGAVTWRYERQGNGVWGWNRGKITQMENVTVATNASGDAYFTFPEAFPNRLESLVAMDSTNPTGWGPLVLKWAPIYSTPARACVRVYDLDKRPLSNRTGLWMTYIAKGS